jgi:hypothetical protein
VTSSRVGNGHTNGGLRTPLFARRGLRRTLVLWSLAGTPPFFRAGDDLETLEGPREEASDNGLVSRDDPRLRR